MIFTYLVNWMGILSRVYRVLIQKFQRRSILHTGDKLPHARANRIVQTICQQASFLSQSGRSSRTDVLNRNGHGVGIHMSTEYTHRRLIKERECADNISAKQIQVQTEINFLAGIPESMEIRGPDDGCGPEGCQQVSTCDFLRGYRAQEVFGGAESLGRGDLSRLGGLG